MTIDSSSKSPEPERPPRRAGWEAIVAFSLSIVFLGAGPPEAIRIQVPAEKVSRWFPAGTEIRGLSAAQFESLFAAARAGYQQQVSQAPARLLQARHFARWSSGLLQGRSELVVEAPPGSGESELKLSPWTPAIEASGHADPASAGLRLYDDGRTAVRVKTGKISTVTLKWQLRARSGSQGRGFTLALPEIETSRLTLDLPKDWEPQGPGGIRLGPRPAEETGRVTWEFAGRGGPIDLQLHSRRADGNGIEEPRAWVSGPTRIELGDALADWTMEWMVDLDPRAPRRFQVELDQGLDFAGVTGPGVEESRVEVVGQATRVTVLLNGQVSGPSPVTFRAVASIPSEGPWSVPAARPLDAVWTGGKTSVRLNPTRILSDCREAAGRRIPERAAGEAVDANLIVFEASEPRSVAVLTFAKPREDVSVEVRGQLLLGNSAPRLESQLTWRVHRGRLLALDVDLPPAWVPERVHVAGLDEPLAWHQRSLPGGGVRLHVTPPSGDFARNSLVLNLDANAAIAGGRGPITLPRVRPVGVEVVDERWLAWTESGLTLHPEKATGLAWIAPALVIGPTNGGANSPAGLREALAWRWIADQAEARVNRERQPEESRGSIQLVASVDRDRLRLDWRISVNAGEERIHSIPLALPAPIDGGNDWRFTEEVTATELPRKPIEPARRAELGLPESGQAWELELPDAPSGTVVVRSRLEVPWKGDGTIPLLVLPERFLARNFVIVDVARQLQTSLKSTAGLQELEPTVAEEATKLRERAEGQDLGFDPVPRRRAYAFSYTNPGGRLELQTETLEPAANPGVVEQAVLTTFIDPQGPLRHRLILEVSMADARVLDLTLPHGATLVQVKRDGQTIAPVLNALALSFPLPVPTSARNSCTFVLDYQTPRRVSSAESKYSPERPAASLPYLAFRWEVVVPEPWSVVEHGPSLRAADPFSRPSGLARFVPSRRWAKQTTSRRDAETLHLLDLRAAETTTTEMSLGECFTRWDAGAVPLVIDRMALESAGWGPRSRITPPANSRSNRGKASAMVRPLGIELVPLGGALLVTSRVDAPDRPGGAFRDDGARPAWEAKVREALVNGADDADRFQVVARWRGESTRRIHYGTETTDVDPAVNGRRIWRFTTTGWPETGSTIHLVNEQCELATAWSAAFAVLALGLVGRRLVPERLALGLAGLLFICLVGLMLTAPRPSPLAAGGAAGVIAVALYGLGRALAGWPQLRAREPRLSASSRLRAGSGAVTTLLVGSALFLGGHSRPVKAVGAGASDGGDEAPIVVLYPFEGAADPTRALERVVIRLRDYERLKALAERSRTGDAFGPAAVTATHRVTWQGAGGVVIESDIELVGGDPRSAHWSFPVGKARDISATLDDVEIPVQIQPGGQAATVLVVSGDKGTGPRKLRLRRFVTPRRLTNAETISLPINALASARVEIGPGPAGRRIEVPIARGAISPRAGGLAGNLGPADRLEVRWVSSNEQERSLATGTVEGLVLWDAEPAGDRARARLTFRNPEGTSVIRLGLDPGVVVRSSTIPGQSDAGLQATTKGVEWVAHVDPPLPDGTTIRLEFWRPLPVDRDRGASAEAVRSLPRIEPLGVESYSGSIAFRRPADWVGRLSPQSGTDPITEEMFVRTWGNLPEEPLTLSGVTRFLRASLVSVQTGPQPSRLSVLPAVELELGPGRVEMTMDARLTQVSGRSYQAEFEVPKELQLVRVEGDGLTDWSRSDRRVRLRFDGGAAKQRMVRVQGWLPVAYDPLATGTIHQQVAVPWPNWLDVDLSPGTLVVAASTAFQLAIEDGVRPSAPDLEDLGLARVRNTYRVDRAEGIGPLRWDVEPPRVDVQVRSQLTINPNSAEWVAVLRYSVSGGACDTIRIKLPTAWAGVANVALAGGNRQLTSVSRGAATFLTIRPEQPIWGSQDVIVRAVRSLAKTSSLRFPDLEPTVNGSSEIDLAIVNASGREFTTEGSPGLQLSDEASRFQSEEFSPTPGLPTSVYRVNSKEWSLKIEAHGGTPLAHEVGGRHTTTGSTEVESVVRGNGTSLGSMTCLIEDHSGPFFSFSLPKGSTPVWVSLNGRPTRPLWAESGHWLVPLEARRRSELLVVWKSALGPLLDGGRTLPIPGLDREWIPDFLMFRTPSGWNTTSQSPTFTSVAADRQDMIRAERLGTAIIDRLSTIDRSSLEDRESVVAALVDFGMLLRSAERGAVWESASPFSTREAEIQLIRSRIRNARQAVTEAVETAALDELTRAAQVHLGLTRDDSLAPSLELPEPNMPVRLRWLGQSHRFVGEPGGIASSNAIRGALNPPHWLEENSQAVPFAWAACVFPPIIWGLARLTGPPSLRRALLVVPIFALVALIGGPWPFIAAFAVTGLGRFTSEA